MSVPPVMEATRTDGRFVARKVKVDAGSGEPVLKICFKEGSVGNTVAVSSSLCKYL